MENISQRVSEAVDRAIARRPTSMYGPNLPDSAYATARRSGARLTRVRDRMRFRTPTYIAPVRLTRDQRYIRYIDDVMSYGNSTASRQFNRSATAIQSLYRGYRSRRL